MPSRSPMSTDEEYVGPVERSIREAMARGEFDDLPGAGKPLPDIDRQYDPDWWARRYLEQMKAQDAADDVRRSITRELPLLRTMGDRAAAQARADELNTVVAEVNRALPEADRIEPIEV